MWSLGCVVWLTNETGINFPSVFLGLYYKKRVGGNGAMRNKGGNCTFYPNKDSAGFSAASRTSLIQNYSPLVHWLAALTGDRPGTVWCRSSALVQVAPLSLLPCACWPNAFVKLVLPGNVSCVWSSSLHLSNLDLSKK